jgi:hypothetical protein
MASSKNGWHDARPKSPCRTRMRSPPVKSQTIPLSGVLLFCAADRAGRRRQSVAWADASSVCRCPPSVAAPHTSGGAVATGVASAEHHGGAPRRPRHAAVPAYRPSHRCGYAGAVGQFVAGAGEGQPPCPAAPSAASAGASAGVQSPPRALGEQADADRGVPRRRPTGPRARWRQAEPRRGP